MYRQPRNVVSSCDNAKLVIGVNELSVEPGETGYIEKYERVLDFELPLQIPSSGLKGGGCSVLTVKLRSKPFAGTIHAGAPLQTPLSGIQWVSALAQWVLWTEHGL